MAGYTRRTAKRITHDGVTLSIEQWALLTGIHRNTIRERINAGKSPAEALQPVDPQTSKRVACGIANRKQRYRVGHKLLTVKQMAKACGLPSRIIRGRLTRGISPLQAMLPIARPRTKITYNGITDSKVGWDERIGASRGTVNKRLQAGWTIAQAIETPIWHGGPNPGRAFKHADSASVNQTDESAPADSAGG